MDIIEEVIKGLGDRIIITTEGGILEIKIMIGIGVGHIKERIETEGMVEALVTVDQGQVQGQLQIGIGLDALKVENMIILQGTVQLHRQIERTDPTDVQYGQRSKNISSPTDGCRSRQTDYKSRRD